MILSSSAKSYRVISTPLVSRDSLKYIKSIWFMYTTPSNNKFKNKWPTKHYALGVL